MSKKILSILSLIVVIVVALGIFSVLSKKENKPKYSGQFVIAGTIFPISDIAHRIAGEKIVVHTIIPAGVSPHTFELSPLQMKELESVDVIFSIGGEFDMWTKDLSDATGAEIIEVGKNIEKLSSDESVDPHYWLSLENTGTIAETIAGTLIEKDNMHGTEYFENLRNYKNLLDEKKQEFTSLLSPLSNRKLITFHDSWGYFAKEFDLEIAGVFISSPGKEPTPRYLKELHDTAKEYNVASVFSEPQLSPETIRPFVEDLNLSLFVLDPIGGVEGRNSYIDLMSYNIHTIYDALKK